MKESLSPKRQPQKHVQVRRPCAPRVQSRRKVKGAIGISDSDVLTWLDDLMISRYTCAEYRLTLGNVFIYLSNANRSLKCAKSVFAAPSQELHSLIFGDIAMRLSLSKVTALVKLPGRTTVEELRAFRGLTGYLRNAVQNCSFIVAPVTNFLRNEASISRRARKLPIEWRGFHIMAFVRLKDSLSRLNLIAFPSYNDLSGLQTDASTV